MSLKRKDVMRFTNAGQDSTGKWTMLKVVKSTGETNGDQATNPLPAKPFLIRKGFVLAKLLLRWCGVIKPHVIDFFIFVDSPDSLEFGFTLRCFR